MTNNPREDEAFAHHLTILSVSAGMVGVCLTAIGIIGVVASLKRLETLCDDLLVADALFFLSSAVLTFLALRTPLRRRSRIISLVIDILFCLGLVLMVGVCGLIVWVVV